MHFGHSSYCSFFHYSLLFCGCSHIILIIFVSHASGVAHVHHSCSHYNTSRLFDGFLWHFGQTLTLNRVWISCQLYGYHEAGMWFYEMIQKLVYRSQRNLLRDTGVTFIIPWHFIYSLKICKNNDIPSPWVVINKWQTNTFNIAPA